MDNYDEVIEHNNNKIEELNKKNDDNKFMKKEMALCTAGSLAFVAAIVSFADANFAVSTGSLIASGITFCGAIEAFCSKVDSENEIYYLQQRNEFYKNLNDTKVLKK